MTQQDAPEPNRLSQFADSLDHSLSLARLLESVMLEETRAIETRDTEGLERVVAQKAGLVADLEAETTRQKRWVEEAGQPFTPAGMAQFFDALDDDDALRRRWSELRASIGRCDRLNEANASLIERDRKRVAATLGLLEGDDGSASTYDPRGRKASTSPRSRPISQA